MEAHVGISLFPASEPTLLFHPHPELPGKLPLVPQVSGKSCLLALSLKPSSCPKHLLAPNTTPPRWMWLCSSPAQTGQALISFDAAVALGTGSAHALRVKERMNFQGPRSQEEVRASLIKTKPLCTLVPETS